MRLERVALPGAGIELSGLLYRPDTTRRGAVVVSHGFTASKESVDLLAAYLCARGHTCVTFDARGHKLGGSGGELLHAEEAVEDLSAVVGWTVEGAGGRVALVGHSMGALLSLVVAQRRPDIAAVAAIATRRRPSDAFGQPIGIAMLSQRSDYVAGAEPMALLDEMGVLADSLGQVSMPALLVAARADALAKPARVEELARSIGAEYAEVEGSHLEAPNRARGLVADWLQRTF